MITEKAKVKVKSVTAFRKPKKEDKVYYYEFDADGNRILEVTYNNNEPEQEIKRTFQNGHPLTERIHYIPDDIFEEISFEYDNTGQVVKSEKAYGDGSIEVTNYLYNEDGGLLSRVTTSEGEVENEDIFEYDGKSMVAHERSECGEPVLKITRKVDENGNILEETRWSTEDGKTLKLIYTPREKDLLPNVKVYNESGKVIEALVHTYDEKGRLIEDIIESSEKGYRRFITRYDYDDNGNLILEETLNKDGVVTRQISRTYNDDNLLTEEHSRESRGEDGIFVNHSMFFDYAIF